MAIVDLDPVKRSMKGVKMLPKHRQLCDEYLANGLDAHTAALAVGYRKTAKGRVYEIFMRPEVRRYLEKRLAELQEQQYIRKAELLAKMKRLNDFNLMKAAANTRNGRIEIRAEDYERVADEIGDCVTEVEFHTTEEEDGSTETTVRIKLMDKDKNFDRELKYHGLLSIDEVNLHVHGPKIDFDELCESPNGEDVVEGRIVGKGSNG